MTDPHVLYRFFDQEDRLLYVGITLEIAWRWKAHSKHKPWWQSVARATMEHFDSREAALAAEREAIIAERPTWNVVHNAEVAKPAARATPPPPRRQVDQHGARLSTGKVVKALRDAGYEESEQTVRRLIDAGKLASYRTEAGGHRRVSAESVERLIASRRGRPPRPADAGGSWAVSGATDRPAEYLRRRVRWSG